MCISDIQANDPEWYQVLTAHLTTEQQKALQEVMVLADQRKAAAESKRIEQSGGKYLWIQHCAVHTVVLLKILDTVLCSSYIGAAEDTGYSTVQFSQWCC
jgi:hypothetical protein